MKRIFLSMSLLLLLILTGCSYIQNKATEESEYDFEYVTGIYDKTYWDSYRPPVSDCIETPEEAVRLCEIIIDPKLKEEGLVAKSVFYDTEDELWIVRFGPDTTLDKDVAIVGGAVAFAIRKKDAQVIKFWGEE